MSRRSERVASAIKRESSILLEQELKDPRIGFITVTKATVTSDLRNAIVYYSVLGDEKTKKLAKKGLASASKFMRVELAKRLKLKFAPVIRFTEDDTLEYTQKIQDMINKIKNEE